MKRNMDSGRQPSHAGLDGRLPWWMYLIGLSYIITFGVIFYLIFWGPAELTGFVNAFSDGAMVIRSVDDPNSPVAKGGLRAGDRVLTIDDRPMRAVRDWTESTGNSQAGRSQRWVVSRGGDRVTLEIVPVGVTSIEAGGRLRPISDPFAYIFLFGSFDRLETPGRSRRPNWLMVHAHGFHCVRIPAWMGRTVAGASICAAAVVMDSATQPICTRRHLPLILRSLPATPGNTHLGMARDLGARSRNASLAR
jgi:PDZ domain